MSKVPREELGKEELEIFDAEFLSLPASFLADRKVMEIFETNKDFILECAKMAKAKFNASFWGVDAQTGFGWQLIRPEHLLRLTTDTGVTNTEWKKTIAVAGWADWIGTSTTPNKIKEEAILCILGLFNFSPSPKAYACILKVQNITYPVWYFERAMRLQNSLKVFALPRPKAILPERTIYGQLKYSATGEDETGVLGITFAEAIYLQEKTPTLESP